MFQLLLIVIYLAFIGLGLPDALLGAAWPSIYREFSVPVSYMGGVSMIIAAGTIISSLASDRLTRKFGAGKVTFVSVLLTAAAILGFSLSGSYGALCFWAVPYGLGAGSVDAALNNYVALHYASRHMSWLHCMWGVGASVGPYVMGWALGGGHGWSAGYACIAMIQTALASVLFFSLPLWKKASGGAEDARGEKRGRALSLPQILKIRGAKEMLAAFCCYSALEQTAGLWASSYLVLCRGLPPEEAARCAALFFAGITAVRAAGGFITVKFSDAQMIRIGLAVILSGAAALLLPLGPAGVRCGLLMLGLGCAPVYPAIIHSTPGLFGADRSQAMIGVEMACAYTGTCLVPPLFGCAAGHTSMALLPFFLLVVLALTFVLHEKTLAKAAPFSSLFISLKLRNRRRGRKM